MINIKELTDKELQEAVDEIERRQEASNLAVISQIDELAQSIGMVAILHGVDDEPIKAPLPAKFADDNGNSWSGRGRCPKWLVEAMADGTPMEAFAV